MQNNQALNPIPVKFLVTHKRADFDEVAAVFILQQLPEAEQFFPGVNNAGVAFWDAGRTTVDGCTATDDWIRKAKVLPVGVGGGEFDEHPVPGRARTTDECAATLVAKKIGVSGHLHLQEILKFAERVNNTATASPDDISSLIKLHHSNGKLSMQEIFDWAHAGIAAKYYEATLTDDFSVNHIAELIRAQNSECPSQGDAWLQVATDAKALDQELFLSVTAKEYQEKKNLVPFTGIGRRGKLKEMQILVIRSDDPRIQRYARSPYGDRPAVIIQMRSTGNVVIMTNKYDGVNLRDVSTAIQAEEAIKNGQPVPNWGELREELQHGVWYFFTPGQALFNGSLTSPGTPPTKQSLPQIVRIVKSALSVGEFPSSREKKCKQGQCTSLEHRPCEWYQWGLSRCRKIRFDAFEVMKARREARVKT